MPSDMDVLDQLVASRDPQELFAKEGLLDELKKALSERMLTAELDEHLEIEGAEGAINRRNGSSRKTMLTGTSKVTLDVPHDRAGTFDDACATDRALRGQVELRRYVEIRNAAKTWGAAKRRVVALIEASSMSMDIRYIATSLGASRPRTWSNSIRRS